MSEEFKSPNQPFPHLYSRLNTGLRSRNPEYQPESEFIHGEWVTVGRFTASSESDGGSCEVQECRMPAEFFRVVVPDYRNSVGEHQRGFILETGSGDQLGDLAFSMARAICEGTLGCNSNETCRDCQQSDIYHMTIQEMLGLTTDRFLPNAVTDALRDVKR